MDFFLMGLDVQRKWFIAHREDMNQLPWDDIHKGTAKLEHPLEFRLSFKAGGEMPPDGVWVGPGLLVVSPRVIDVLESLSATGYRTHPVILRHPVLGITIHEYQGLLVHGNGGPLDEDRSKPRHSPGPNRVIMSMHGTYIHEDRWDGSDMFRIEGLGYNRFVTSRVAEALQGLSPKLRVLSFRANTKSFP